MSSASAPLNVILRQERLMSPVETTALEKFRPERMDLF